MNIIKKNIKQATNIARLLLFSIGLLMSFNIFATPGGLPAEVEARKAADAALQDQINNIPIPSVYEIGDILDDGSIVFYVDDSGEHGLAAWPENEEDEEDSRLEWYSAGEAADAHGFRWHLPTKAELNLLFAEKDLVGGLEDGYYWSSTEYFSDRAWIQSFFSNGGGTQLQTWKFDDIRVRAVRAF
jgi:hypothetical protein